MEVVERENIELEKENAFLRYFFKQGLLIYAYKYLKVRTIFSDLLFLGDSKIFKLPDFIPANCSIPSYPVSGLRYSVTGLVKGSVMTCGG